MGSRTRQKPITDDVLAVLHTATVEGHHVKLQCGQLDRDLYKRVNEVLANLGGKWKGGKVAAHVFAADPAPLLAQVLGAETVVVPPKNPLNYFPTARGVVLEMIRNAAIPTGAVPVLRVLEPSCGEGHIIRTLYEERINVDVYGCEIDPLRIEACNGVRSSVMVGDFLDCKPGVTWQYAFDRVLMNPPFECPGNSTCYVDHVRHAFRFLDGGGRLVAICPSGWTFTNTKKLAGFRNWVDEHGYWIALEEGAFKESGTGANCVMIICNKA